MKKLKLSAVFLGCLLTSGFLALAEPSEADQKWLKTVEQMVTKGDKKLSTPSESRVTLLKEWGKKNGYAVEVTKTEKGFALEVSKKDAAKTVAQK